MSRHTKHTTIQNEFWTCDFCGKRPREGVCSGCGLDVCDECCITWFNDPWDDDDNGDYPPVACEFCHAKVAAFAERVAAIRDEADRKIEAIKAEWKAACVRNNE